jgi:hypothetical protein
MSVFVPPNNLVLFFNPDIYRLVRNGRKGTRILTGLMTALKEGKSLDFQFYIPHESYYYYLGTF